MLRQAAGSVDCRVRSLERGADLKDLMSMTFLHPLEHDLKGSSVPFQ